MSEINPMTLGDLEPILGPHGQFSHEIPETRSKIDQAANVGAVAIGVICYVGMVYGNHLLCSHLEAVGKLSQFAAVGARMVPSLLVFTAAAGGIWFGVSLAIIALGDCYLVNPQRALGELARSWNQQATIAGPGHFRQLADLARPHHLRALLHRMTVNQQIQLRHVVGASFFDRKLVLGAGASVSPYWKLVLSLPRDRTALIAYLTSENVQLRFKNRPAYLQALARVISERMTLDAEITELLKTFYERVKGNTNGQDEFLRDAESSDYDPQNPREGSVEITSASGSLYLPRHLLARTHVTGQLEDGQFQEGQSGEMDIELTEEQHSVLQPFLSYLNSTSLDSTAGDELKPHEKLCMIDLIEYLKSDKESITHLHGRLIAWRENERSTTTVATAFAKWREACRGNHDGLKELYLEALRQRLTIRANVATLFHHAGNEELPPEILALIDV